MAKRGWPYEGGRSKRRFSSEEVEEIRKVYDEEETTYRKIAERKGCAVSMVFKIINRYTYFD